MKRISAAKWCVYGALFAALPFLLQCAALQPRVGPKPAAPSTGASAPKTAKPDTASRPVTEYRFEDELPEKTPHREAPLVERIEPVAADTFSVQDGAIEAPQTQQAPQAQQKQMFSIGYRIQVYASADRAAAERMKERVATEARLPSYVDFEDGLYKVRAGDFAERKDAAQAKLAIEKIFPGSWIVRTTIRTE